MKRILLTIIISFIAIFYTGCDVLEEALADFSGCTLEDAPNYDGSKSIPCATGCINEQTGANCCCEEIIYGCLDTSANNYNPNANAPCNDNGIQNDCCVYPIAGFLMLTIINAYNLIDGIDGLAAIVGIVILIMYTTIFYITGHYFYALLCLSLNGSLMAFLAFNLSSTRPFINSALLIPFISAFSFETFPFLI